jgi:hypothetical protein
MPAAGMPAAFAPPQILGIRDLAPRTSTSAKTGVGMMIFSFWRCSSDAAVAREGNDLGTLVVEQCTAGIVISKHVVDIACGAACLRWPLADLHSRKAIIDLWHRLALDAANRFRAATGELHEMDAWFFAQKLRQMRKTLRETFHRNRIGSVRLKAKYELLCFCHDDSLPRKRVYTPESGDARSPCASEATVP